MYHTLNDLIQIYEREYLPGKAPSTQVQQRHLYQRIRADLGAILLQELTPLRLRQWRDLLRQKYRPGSVRCYLESVSALLTVAVNELEWLDSHPMRKVQKPSSLPGRVRFLTQEEQARLLHACKGHRSPYLYPMVVLALYTGCRKGEIQSLTWPEVDFEHACLRLKHTKNGERRVVPLVGEALRVLHEHYETRRLKIAWVFPRPDGQKPVDIDTSWQRLLKRIALTDFHFHDLRHTAASYLAMSGATLAEIAEVLGHKNIQVTKRYSHFLPSHTAGVVARMAAQFLPAPDPSS